jgi:hypothetical protein
MESVRRRGVHRRVMRSHGRRSVLVVPRRAVGTADVNTTRRPSAARRRTCYGARTPLLNCSHRAAPDSHPPSSPPTGDALTPPLRRRRRDRLLGSPPPPSSPVRPRTAAAPATSSPTTEAIISSRGTTSTSLSSGSMRSPRSSRADASGSSRTALASSPVIECVRVVRRVDLRVSSRRPDETSRARVRGRRRRCSVVMDLLLLLRRRRWLWRLEGREP